MNEERTVRSMYVSTYSENPPTVGDTSASDSIKATERTQSVTQLSCLHAGCGCLAPARCVAEKFTILPE